VSNLFSPSTVRRPWRIKRQQALAQAAVRDPMPDDPPLTNASQRPAFRCDALIKSGDRCGRVNLGLWFRDGRHVCKLHLKQSACNIKYFCGDRVGAYGATMALALGDDP
jgi:hypothetical protein